MKKPGWREITHPGAKEKGHREFENDATGEKIRYDEGKPGKPGHSAHDHYHRPNPDQTDKRNEFLDANGNPVVRGSDEAHLYPPEWVWWN